MTTTARTDIHRPSAPEFDPARYICRGVFDTDPEEGNPAAFIRAVAATEAAGYRWGRPAGSCGHCGARLRYVALMIHDDSGEMIVVGEDCLALRFTQTKAEFRRLMREAAEARARQEVKAARQEFLAYHPELAVLITGNEDPESFLGSLADQLRRKGWLSARQVEAARAVLAQRAERQVEDVVRAERVCAVLGPVGAKIEFSGVVRVAMVVDGYAYNSSQVFLVIETPTGDVKAYTAARWAYDVQRGEEITCSATVKAHAEYADQPQTVVTRIKKGS
jgi:hypothetical protein